MSPALHWSGANIKGEVVQVADEVMHRFIDSDAVFVGLLESCLERAAETAAAGNSEDHTSQFAHGFVPVFDRHTVAAFEVFEYVEESQPAVFRELNGFGNGVHYPAKENLARGPLCITLCQLAKGYRLFAVLGVGRGVRAE